MSYEPYMWTTEGGEGLGWVEDSYSAQAHAVTNDGTIVGYGSTKNSFQAFRWTSGAGFDLLSQQDGATSLAFDITADGAFVVGRASFDPTTNYTAMRWSPEGETEDLDPIERGATAYAVSADGSVVVGEAGNRAFRWTASGGLQDLGTLGGLRSRANGVSADGSVVIGSSLDTGGRERAFRWTIGEGMVDMGTLGGTEARASAVSSDGAVVAGLALDTSGSKSLFIWTAGTGMRSIETMLSHAGVDLSAFAFNAVHAVSGDGSVVVGEGIESGRGGGARGWRATLAPPTSSQHAAPELAAVLRSYPAPARDHVTVELTGAEGQAVVALYDVLGRRVDVLHDGPVALSGWTVTADVARLPAGAYSVRAEIGGAVRTAKVTVVR